MRLMFSGLLLAACNGNPPTSLISDEDEDGYFSDVDCEPDDPLINPGAQELCDLVDNDCDGQIDENDAFGAQLWFPDSDGDGFGDPLGPIGGCEAPDDNYINNPDDCDDSDFNVNPLVDEVCDGVDNDCDGTADEDSALDAQLFYQDGDGDGFGNPFVFRLGCGPGDGYVAGDPLDATQIDCDDGKPLVNPAATEICDDEDTDEDCDSLINDADPSLVPDRTWYFDSDGDGYGDPAFSFDSCLPPSDFVGNAEDCDDDELTVNPEGIEICGDGIDNDCNNLIDVADDNPVPVLWYFDGDSDGFGDAEIFEGPLCVGRTGYVPNPDDCDDDVMGINPDAEEVWYDGIDQDCDRASDFDADFDGFDSADFGGGDCADEDEAISPGAIEICNDDIDNNCDLNVDPCEINVTITAAELEDEAGYSMVVGDVSGDGEPELILGAPYVDSDYIGSGAVFILEADLEEDVTLDEEMRLDGGSVGEAAGWSLSISPDFTGDDIPDLLVGAYRLDGVVSELGGVYLLAGPITVPGVLADADAIFLGEAGGDAAGWQIDARGDLNHDGDFDLLISALDEGDRAGAVYVLYGPQTTGARLWGANMKITGEASNDEAGIDLTFTPDVDGDGIDDVAIGAPNHSERSNEGAMYVLRGGTALSDSISLSDADGARFGVDGGDEAGMSVAAVGDVTGDGLADLLVGAPGFDGEASETGAAYLVAGPVSGEQELSTAYAQIEGLGEDSAAGGALSIAGDINGDDITDLLIGAPNVDAEESGAGAVYLMLGPVSGATTLQSADGVLYGSAAGEALGATLLNAGDLNGDTFDDVLVGAPSNEIGGEIYLMFGGGW